MNIESYPEESRSRTWLDDLVISPRGFFCFSCHLLHPIVHLSYNQTSFALYRLFLWKASILIVVHFSNYNQHPSIYNMISELQPLLTNWRFLARDFYILEAYHTNQTCAVVVSYSKTLNKKIEPGRVVRWVMGVDRPDSALKDFVHHQFQATDLGSIFIERP